MTGPGRFRDLDGRDAYEILGVSPTATRQEISRARRDRQRTAHPDQGGIGDNASKLINAAAAILLDGELRRAYDEWRGGPDPTGPPSAAPSAWDTAEPGFIPRPRQSRPSAWDTAEPGFTPTPPPFRAPPHPAPPAPGPGPGPAPMYGSPHVMPHLGQPPPVYYHEPPAPRNVGGRVALGIGLFLGGICLLLCAANALVVSR